MGTPITSAEWPRLVLPIVRKVWDQKRQAVASPLMALIGVQTSTSSVEYSQGVGSFGLVPEYNSSTAEGAPAAIEYDSFNPLYEATFTHKEYAKGVAIERKLWDDDRMGAIKNKAATLGHAFGTTRAYHCSSILNNAFATVTGYDNVYLCSASHPTSEADATAVSNLGTTALSYTAVNTVLAAGAAMKDDRGMPMPVIYDILYVPVALKAKAIEIVGAAAKPGTADNDANAIAGLRVVVDPYLTDANDWFMISSAEAAMHCLWFDRVAPELAMSPDSDYTLAAKYRGYMRYSFGWDDFRWIYGQHVT